MPAPCLEPERRASSSKPLLQLSALLDPHETAPAGTTEATQCDNLLDSQDIGARINMLGDEVPEPEVQAQVTSRVPMTTTSLGAFAR